MLIAIITLAATLTLLACVGICATDWQDYSN